jgi:Trk-type K+ transport system membrane component
MNSVFFCRLDTTLLVLTVLGGLLWSATTTVTQGAAFLIGATLGFANLAILRRFAGAAIERTAAGSSVPSGLSAIYVIKLGASGLLIFALITVVRADAVSLALGFSVVPAAILFEFLRWNLTATHPRTETR